MDKVGPNIIGAAFALAISEYFINFP